MIIIKGDYIIGCNEINLIAADFDFVLTVYIYIHIYIHIYMYIYNAIVSF